ncbi:MAG TPA: peptidase S8 [Ktedonobacteraceae bacterium]|nr:peptidase S8 [Ktedonobacteraceae bacterium]
MKKLAITLTLVVAWALVAMGATPGAFASSASIPASRGSQQVQACGAVSVGYARCMAILAVASQFRPDSGGPAGYHPADLQSAYALPSTSQGKGETVAIVDAFDDPNAEADLGVYRSTFGLPACTTGNGCFKKVNETGGKKPPVPNAGWAQEISLDLDMVSAICPNCHIILVEATTNHLLDLGASVNEAVKLGANAESNSYSGNEKSSEISIEKQYFTHPGVAITASSGDSGYPNIGNPAVFTTLTAVGGTSLFHASNKRGWKESVWGGAGSGCSIYIPKPSWQKDKGCSMRTVADVAAVADPGTGVSVYDTYNEPGWLVFGGTSVSSPIIASVYALAGNTGSINDASYIYAHTSSLHDVKSGSNGSCGGSYLCTGVKGYDGPTGNGTPNGTGAF